jgi:hypothetical protein
LGENSKFAQNKNNTLKRNFSLISLLNICHCNSGWFKKTINIASQNLCVFQKRKFPKLMSKTHVNFVNDSPDPGQERAPFSQLLAVQF